jgi:N-ethylmaleimide reductase
MPKLLTPVNLGALSLSHRVVVTVPPRQGRRLASAYSRPATSGGLVIQTMEPDRALWTMSKQDRLPDRNTWRRTNDIVRAKSGMSLGQIAYSVSTEPSYAADPDTVLAAYRHAARQARAAGFDGVELSAVRHLADQPAIPLLEAVQAMIDVWGADYVGIQLAPFAWMTGRDDERAAEAYSHLLHALAGMEIAYVRLSGTVTNDRGDLATSPMGLCLRAAFPGMLIASGEYTPASAIAAVASRFADAIGFTLATGSGDDLMRAITAVGGPSSGRR